MKTKLILLLALFGFIAGGLAEETPPPKLTKETAEKMLKVQLEVELLDKGNPAGSRVRCKVSILNNTSTPITVYDRENRRPVWIWVENAERRFIAEYSDMAKENPPPETASITIPAKGRIAYEIIFGENGGLFGLEAKNDKPIVFPKGQYTARAGFFFDPKKFHSRTGRSIIRIEASEVKFAVE